ncbi:MAG: glutamate synthase-related protein, partial [Leeuwenhoekiella sp.]
FKDRNLTERIVFVGSGKLGLPAQAAMAFAMGVDVINVGREAMLAVGCIQSKVCHNNTCPSGVATQNKWLQAGIDIKDKSVRAHFYFKNFRKELLEITHACGYEHPCQMTMEDVDFNLGDKNLTQTLASSFGYHKVKVPFKDVKSLQECGYLGGNYDTPHEEKKTEKAEKKEEVRY